MKYLLFIVMFLFPAPVSAQQYVNTVEIDFVLTAQDAESGVEHMQFSNNQSFTDAVPEPFSELKTDWQISPGDGEKTVYVRFKDFAGNWGIPYSVTFTVDTVPPTGTINFQIRVTVTGE